MFGVGHGDCFLLQWQPENGEPWSLLIDGGPNVPQGGHSLHDVVGKLSIDKVVLTHVDADHLDGLFDLSPKQVKEFWGPCLPAFRRHAWLFPQRVQAAVERTANLESKLKSSGIPILYPLEGYRDASPDRRLTVRVLSPPPRLIARLLWSHDATALFLKYPTPMGWLLQREVEHGDPQESRIAMQARMLEAGCLKPEDLFVSQPFAGSPSDASALRGEWCQEYGEDPEFFGNHVLNDSSIVLWIEVLFDGQTTRRLLFPGDLENWVYLSGRHSTTLACDFLKAPHHGGRVFLEKHKEVAFDEVYQQLRPQIVAVSGCGRHQLPRGAFRETVARWGGSLFCSSQRRKELIIGLEDSAESCFERFQCTSNSDPTSITITRDRCEVDRPACLHVPRQGAVPVVLLKQHVIDPSPLLEHFTEGELYKHVEWIVGQLRNYHAERVRLGMGNVADVAVTGDTLTDAAKSAGRYRLVPELATLLHRAKKEERIWCDEVTWDRKIPCSYILPTTSEEKSILTWLRRFRITAFSINQENNAHPNGPQETLTHANTDAVANLIAESYRFPIAMFREAIWPLVSQELLKNWNGYLSGASESAGRRVLFCFKKTESNSTDKILSEVLVPCPPSKGHTVPRIKNVWNCNWEDVRRRSQGLWPLEAKQYLSYDSFHHDESGINHAIEVVNLENGLFALSQGTISLW